MLENIAAALAPWGMVAVIVVVCATLAWWAMLGQDILPRPWGVKKLPDTRCPLCREHEGHALYCSLHGCPIRVTCQHQGCGLVGRDRLKCDYLACFERECAERAFGVAPAAQVISIEGCSAVSGGRRHRR
jgi:hypothetical protein